MSEFQLKTPRLVLRELRQPKVAVMLALGFSSGLPFLLTANTFGSFSAFIIVSLYLKFRSR